MTLAELISEALVLLDEPSDGSFWSSAEQTLLAKRASRLVYYRLSAVQPQLLTVSARFSYPADTEAHSLNTALSENVLRILSVSYLQSNAVVSASNRPSSLEEIDHASVASYSDSSYYPGGDIRTPYWSYERGNLRLVPPPTVSQTVYIQYVPFPRDTALVLDNIVPEFEDLVVEILVTLMSAKERDLNQALVVTQTKVDEYIRSFTNAKTRTRKLITGNHY